MSLPDRVRRLPLRTRLTALYGVAFFGAGAVLVAVMYGVVAVELERQPSVAPAVAVPGEPLPSDAPVTRSLEPATDTLVERIRSAEQRRRDATLDRLLWQSLLALGVVGLTAAGLGFVVAGRALRPLAEITATARRVADRSLHERIGLEGPRDEIKELADTFDEMLARLDRSFGGQRHFVGNASHELRTPLAVQRTVLEVALADPDASEDLKSVGRTLLETNARSERLIEGLLTLARSENHVSDRRPSDLADLARAALDTCADELRDRCVRVHRSLDRAPVTGDTELLEQLALNLVQNAVRHNDPRGGTVWVRTGSEAGESALEVSNTGAVVPEHELDRIFEPFTRLSRQRTGSSHGLGLSIVRSVAHSHGGSVTTKAREGGGLVVTVCLTAAGQA